MKNFILIITLLLFYSFTSNAQTSPPPPDPSGTGTQPAGGGAPVGEGIFILFGLAAAYGGKKWTERKKQSD